jgi:hypothetical protein
LARGFFAFQSWASLAREMIDGRTAHTRDGAQPTATLLSFVLALASAKTNDKRK